MARAPDLKPDVGICVQQARRRRAVHRCAAPQGDERRVHRERHRHAVWVGRGRRVVERPERAVAPTRKRRLRPAQRPIQRALPQHPTRVEPEAAPVNRHHLAVYQALARRDRDLGIERGRVRRGRQHRLEVGRQRGTDQACHQGDHDAGAKSESARQGKAYSRMAAGSGRGMSLETPKFTGPPAPLTNHSPDEGRHTATSAAPSPL